MQPGLVLAMLWGSPALADDTFDEIKRYWSVEVGAGFTLFGDLTGNARDISRPYTNGDAAGTLPMGSGFFIRNVLHYPLGEVSPALLAKVGWSTQSASTTIEGFDLTTRDATNLDLTIGPGLCIDDTTCLFASYGFRSLTTSDANLPVTNLVAVLGDRDDLTVDPFTEPLLRAVLGDGLVDVLLSQVDFDAQRVWVDLSDTQVMHGGMLSGVSGLGRRLTLDGSLGYFVSQQAHTGSHDVIADIDKPDEIRNFSYDWTKSIGMLGIDFGLSVGVLPRDMPVQLAVGARATALLVIDVDADRSVGSYLLAMGFLSAKW